MTIATPTWLQAGIYSAKRDRQVLAATWDEGVLKPRSFKVTQKTGGANYSVDVAAGRAIVQGDDELDQGNYLVTSDAVENVVWPAPPGSNSRIDILVLQVNDPNAGGAAGDNAVLSVVQGTPAASPTAPAIPDSALPLARVTIVAAQTTITDADITDLRVQSGQVAEVGTMRAYTGADAPSNHIWADGVDQLRADWPELHELYASQGYPYGSGNGSTTFGIPAATNGRSVVGAGVGFAVGAESGSTTKSIGVANLPPHAHSGPSHAHTIGSHQHSGPSHAHSGPSHTHSGTTGTNNTNHHHNVPINVLAPGAFSDTNIASGHNGNSNGVYTAGSSGDSSSHNHSFTTGAAGAGSTSAAGTGLTGSAGAATTSSSGTGNTGSVGSGTAFDVMNPYVVVEGWIIRAA